MTPTANVARARAWVDRQKRRQKCSPSQPGNICLGCATQALLAAVRAQREVDASTASAFTMKRDRSIHPDIPWEMMSEAAQTIAHTTAQQIAGAIRAHAADVPEAPR